MTAQYLLRFDDICETMNWRLWEEIEPLLLEHKIQPLLAVVPQNRDPKLQHSSEREDFWSNVQKWQQEYNWSIALHGYQHLYETNNAGILGTKNQSEFAGLHYERQREKLEMALSVFTEHNIRADAWVAPGHSFDSETLRALSDLGLRVISDGYSSLPYTDTQGAFWVPQQIWRLRTFPFGTWTVCYHINSWTEKELERFRKELSHYQENIISLQYLMGKYKERKQTIGDRFFDSIWRLLLRMKR